ncbi:MAG TPA: 2-phospho-L-lactate transferase CofD family protein [Candidatus Binatia bacterium]|nr:2-phospho-L-lactate transferase CofD family protein [Candidatus Binatia bacterium]
MLLAGGLGGARLAPALARVLGPGRLTVVANVGDDLEWMGLRVCPDLDSIAYALAGLWNRRRGWGRRGETFRVRAGLAALDNATWFGVGDRDLALHLERTRLLQSGRTLTEATRALVDRLGVRGVDVVPASDAPAGTRFRLRDGRLLSFQEWYVREHARAPVIETLLARAPASSAALRALAAAAVVVLAPSNPITSIGAILALRGMKPAVRTVPRCLAVSPVVLRRPSSSRAIAHHARARRHVLEAAGGSDCPDAIARRYAGLVEAFVLDHRDGSDANDVRRAGLEPVLADLLDERSLARTIVEIASRRASPTRI